MAADDVVIRISAKNLSRQAFKQAITDIGGIDTAATKGKTSVGGFGATIGRIAGGIGVATLAMGALRRAWSFAIDAGIGMNAMLETTTLQFETLIGDADAAEAHVRSLFDFAKRTPFESGPIIQASKMLRTFGGDALDTMENLTLIGDAAAATGAPINELGMWTGRLYAQLQAGRPFGEAAQRLTELAVLTPKARLAMEDLQKSGGSAREIFELFEGSLTRFGGAMDKQAETFAGLTSTFWENTKLFIADKSTPAFELLKSTIKSANEVFAEQEELGAYLDSLEDGGVAAEEFARSALAMSNSAQGFNENLKALLLTSMRQQELTQQQQDAIDALALSTTSAADADAEFTARQAELATQEAEVTKEAEKQAIAQAKLNKEFRDSITNIGSTGEMYGRLLVRIPEVTTAISLGADELRILHGEALASSGTLGTLVDASTRTKPQPIASVRRTARSGSCCPASSRTFRMCGRPSRRARPQRRPSGHGWRTRCSASTSVTSWSARSREAETSDVRSVGLWVPRLATPWGRHCPRRLAANWAARWGHSWARSVRSVGHSWVLALVPALRSSWAAQAQRSSKAAAWCKPSRMA